MKLLHVLAVLFLTASPAGSEEWNCQVSYDEVNGGGTFTVRGEQMTFVSNWQHRSPEILKCIRAGQTSECMDAKLSANKTGGLSVFLKLYSIVWKPEGGPKEVTVRQSSVIFQGSGEVFEMSEAFPAIGYKLPVKVCTAN